MRIAIHLLLLCTVVSVAMAQIPNAGFESWTNGDPDGWATNNSEGLPAILQSSTAHGGASAARGDVVDLLIMTMGPMLATGTDAQGFAYSERPAWLTGYYQYVPATSSGDRFFINAGLFKGGVSGTEVAVAVGMFTAATSGYSQFNLTFTYLSSEIPDTAVIIFTILGSGGTTPPMLGSYFLVDDLAFSGTTSVDDQRTLPPAFTLAQNYPNPFNPSTTIRFTLAEESAVRVAVYDVLGREVGVLANEIMQPGVHQTSWNARELPSGVYTCRVTADGLTSRTSVSQMKKMILAK